MMIIIAGPLGVGKTTIAKEIAQKLQGFYISIDRILSENKLDVIPNGSYCIPLDNFLQANLILKATIDKAELKGKDIIVDGCFYHREAFENLLQIVQIPYAAFTLQASLETCIDRDQKRERPLGEDAARAVYKLTSGLKIGERLNAEKSIDQTVGHIIQASSSVGKNHK